MAEGRKHRLGVLIVVFVLLIWMSLIISVITMAMLKKGRKEENKSVQKYPATPNECPIDVPYLYFLNMTLCKSYTEISRNECPSQKVCLPYCPAVTYLPDLDSDEGIELAKRDWIDSRSFVFCVKSTNSVMIPAPDTFEEYLEKVHQNLCPDKMYRSNTFFNNICLPDEPDEPSLDHLSPSKTNKDKNKHKDERSSMELYVMRRSSEMFTAWVTSCVIVSVLFICIYFILFLYFLKFMVYTSLLIFFILLLASLSYSIAMIYLSGNGASEENITDLTLSLHWVYWLSASVIIALILYIYYSFLFKCYYSIPKAVQFLLYASNGIGGLKSALAVTLISMSMQIILICITVYLIYLIYSFEPKVMRVMYLADDCVCINNYTNGSTCQKLAFRNWCRDRISGSRCSNGGCYLYKVDVTRSGWMIIVILGLSTYYLMWYLKGITEMILGTTFVNWYKDNFSTNIPFKHFTNKILYCFKNQCGTLAIGAAVMFFLGLFHTVLQFLEHLVLYTVDVAKSRRKNVFVKFMDKLSKITSPLIYIEAGVFNISYTEASKRVDLTLASKIKNIRLINKLVDMVLFICALVVVTTNTIILLAIYIFPQFFIKKVKSKEIFILMTNPFVIFLLIIISSYFVVSNILTLYSISVNSIFLCYISDKPADVSRKRRYPSSALISEAVNPDKFDVLGKVNDLGESVSPAEKPR